LKNSLLPGALRSLMGKTRNSQAEWTAKKTAKILLRSSRDMGNPRNKSYPSIIIRSISKN
jgi:hypothetical protein